MSVFTFRIRNISEISFLTLISRILGQIRSTLIGALLSTSALADSFMIAWKLPNFLRSLLAEGAASAAFVPLLSEANSNTSSKTTLHPNAQEMFTFLLTLTFFTVIFITGIGILIAPLLTELLYKPAQLLGTLHSSSLAPEELIKHTTLLMRIMFPYLITISLASLLSTWLYTQGQFKSATALPIILNLALILGASLALLLYTGIGEKQIVTLILSSSVIIGGIFQLLLVIHAVKKTGLKLRISLKSLKKAKLEKLSKLIAPITASSLIHQLQLLLLDPIALVLGAGGVTALFFSNRLLEFPLALLVYPILTAAFPDLSRYAATTQKTSFEATFQKSLSLIVLLALFATLFGLLVHTSIVSMVFGFGAFNETSINLTASCLFFHLLALPFISLNRLFTQTLYALKKGKYVVSVTLLSLFTSVGSSLILIQFSRNIPMIALGATIGSALSMSTFVGILHSKKIVGFSFSLPRQLIKLTVKTSLLMLFPAISVFYLRKPIALAIETLKETESSILVVKLFEAGDILTTLLFLGIFTLIALIMSGNQEVRELLDKFKQRWNA